MVRLFVRHDVADYAVWRQGYDEAMDEIGVVGVPTIWVTHTA